MTGAEGPTPGQAGSGSSGSGSGSSGSGSGSSGSGGAGRGGARWGGAVPGLVAVAVAAVIYGPMLRPGFPLRYDLVTVPRPVLGEDALGLGDRLPRAIPLDAVTAALARLLPDGVITQLLALLALTLAGWGVAVLTPGPLPGRLLALLVAEWNPFVLEQLAIGHVPHLFAYGALPWVALSARALVDTRPRSPSVPGFWLRGAAFAGAEGDLAGKSAPGGWRAWGGLTVAAGFGSLTPGGGALVVIAGLAGLAAGWSSGADREVGGGREVGEGQVSGEHRGRRVVAGLVSLAVLQLPWLVAAAAAPAFAASGSAASGADNGVTAFALRSETGWGRLVDAAGLAGMWNQAALPPSRDTVLARVSTVLLLTLAAAGLPTVRRLWRADHGRYRAELQAGAVAAGSGYLVAVLPVLPGGERALGTLIDLLPGAGLLRDGHRWLALPAIGLAVLAGLGTNQLTSWLTAGTAPGTGMTATAGTGRAAGVRVAVAVFAALLVVASMPDLAGGLAGRMQARQYPAEWARARAVLDASDDRARVLVLPWQPFRVFAWSGPDPVLDPAPRLLPRQSIVSDALTVAGQRLPEEGLGARAVAADLADGALDAGGLQNLAVGWVLIERGTPGRVPALPPGWVTVLDGPQLTLLRAAGPLPAAARAGRIRAVAVIGSQGGAGLLVLAGLVALVAGRRRNPRPPATLNRAVRAR